MQFGGNYVLGAPRSAVWAALNDARTLKATIPGCKSIEWVAPLALDLAIEVNFGVVRPVFNGDLTLSEVIPAERYTLSGKGRGGLLGLAEGAADIALTDFDAEAQKRAGQEHVTLPDIATQLAFSARGGASGRIMKLGRTLIGNSAQKVIDGFFARFAEAMGVPILVLALEVPASTTTI